MNQISLAAKFCLAAFCLSLMITQHLSAQDAPQLTDSLPDLSQSLLPGNHYRFLVVDGTNRTVLIHIPPSYSSIKPIPVVIALHGAAMTGAAMAAFSGLNKTADEKGFIVAYPEGTGQPPFLTWNAGGFQHGLGSQSDDVGFLRLLINELKANTNVDSKRIYACGMSNGGMMCYRLASELSDQIAAIAPVGGTMPKTNKKPDRPVSVIHFHGTLDQLVPFETPKNNPPFWLRLYSVNESIENWLKWNGSQKDPVRIDTISNDNDELKVTRQSHAPGKDGSEVVLVAIEGGGHTWPGRNPPVALLGKSTLTVSANDLMWSFFEKHPMK